MIRSLALFGKPRYLGMLSLPDDADIPRGETLLVQSPRGEEMAVLVGTLTADREKALRSMRVHQDPSEGKSSEPAAFDLQFLSVAGEEEVNRMEELRAEEGPILLRAREILKGHQLSMKLIDVEYLVDRKKLFFYFTSEQRVDFRAFVRDLAKEHRTRIEMRQVGVRDEAKIIRGLSPCGRPCCCSYWLQQFAPICIRMVKEQNLALNPTKISGICGRLMCCMSYEHPVYRELWSGLPNPGSKIKTPMGNYVLQGVDLRTRSVRCSAPMGGDRTVPVDRFQEFREAVLAGQDWDLAPKGEGTRQNGESSRPGRREEGGRPRRFEKGDSPRPRKGSASQPETPSQPPVSAGSGGVGPGQDETAAPAKKRSRRKRKRPSGNKELAAVGTTPGLQEGTSQEARPPRPPKPRQPGEGKGEGKPRPQEGTGSTPPQGEEGKKPSRKRRRRSRSNRPKEGAPGAEAGTPPRGSDGGEGQ